MRYRPWLFLTGFLLLALALRWGSFFISVINHDESTYIVIADELLRGGSYLRDVIDTKPIGIFWVYALLIKVTGGGIPALRLAAALIVGLGAWLLGQASYRATHSARAALAAGIVYCFACSIFTYYGLSPNTEIFFNVFTIAAVGLCVAPRTRDPAPIKDPLWHWPAAGLLLGMGCVIKPFVAAEALAVGLFVLWFYGRQKHYLRMLTAAGLLVAAFALPLLGVWLYFRAEGLLDQFYFYTFEVSSAYPVELAWYLRLKYMGDYLLRYAPFVLLGIWAGTRVRRLSGWQWFLLLQFLLVTAVILITGKRFGHYQVQLHPIIALWAATFWLGSNWKQKWILPLIAAIALGIGTSFYFKYAKKKDEPRSIADYLAGKLGPGERVFCINGFQIVYHLINRPAPTPYVHSSLLYLDHHVSAFQIDEQAEARRLLADPQLEYLVGRADDPEADTELTRLLLEEFTPFGEIDEELRVWKRR